MRRMILAILTAALLAGCAPNMEASNERGGIIPQVIGLNRGAAFAAADQHCRKFGRVAQVKETSALNSTLAFDCVAP